MRWTPEARKRQAKLIRDWQPWRKAGVKTAAGKARSRMNAFRHGMHSAAAKSVSLFIRQCSLRLRVLRESLRVRRAQLKNPLVPQWVAAIEDGGCKAEFSALYSS